MAYLSKDDYTLRISVEHLDEVLEEAAQDSALSVDQIRNNAESWAQALVKSYLVSKYNIAAEYALDSASSARNFLIKQVTIDLALCTLHKTINPRDLPEHISKACDASMLWLEQARDGVIVVDLTPQTPASGEIIYQRSFIGSQRKFISKPYSDRSVIGEDDAS
jgi:hypothetical protein